MDVISYRGPGAPGGVSTGLESAWRSQRSPDTCWWFVSGSSLLVLDPLSLPDQARFVTQIPESIIDGHYRFCNGFLWPLMHDLPQYASFDQEEFRQYREFNRIVGVYIAFEQRKSKRYFTNDYQLTMLPDHLSKAGGRVSLFWHIPWPKLALDEHVEILQEIVRGMLKASVIGFHTNEYAENFIKFVKAHLPEYRVDRDKMQIKARSPMPLADPIETIFGLSSFITRPYNYGYRVLPKPPQTQLVVQPLGIDRQQWFEMSGQDADQRVSSILQSVQNCRLVLSVDRADYTKSVIDRMQIIDRFFEEHPYWRGQVAFVQICGRSRAGIRAFDDYWHRCCALAKRVNERWRMQDWQPINWIEEPLPARSLSQLYRHADSMLVNPIRDGLNLTAKEFVACQNHRPGVLLLSPGAGAWHELGEYALPADPKAVCKTADSIAHALNMPPLERKWRNEQLKMALDQNPLHKWWKTIASAEHYAGTLQPAVAKSETTIPEARSA